MKNIDNLLVATSNKGKLLEFKELFKPYNIEIISTDKYDIEPPEETGNSFTENAILKAKYYSKLTNIPALADDSGLSIAALNDQPGIYSARWAGENNNFDIAIDRVFQELKNLNLSESLAYFTCALAIYIKDDYCKTFIGSLKGKVVSYKLGENGFGYDPIFIPQGYTQTLAEMSSIEKNNISHRKVALASLVEAELS